jgi:allantoinase
MIGDATGSRPQGWSSPRVYSNGDTPEADASEGVAYTLDQMHSDIVQRLKTPEGLLMLLPYPVVTVCMGQELARTRGPREIETLWLDYVLGLAAEARSESIPLWSEPLMGPRPCAVFSFA